MGFDLLKEAKKAAKAYSVINPINIPTQFAAGNLGKGATMGPGAVRPDVPLPVLKEMNPELYKQIILQNPELETSVNLGQSAMQGISLDPKTRQAQMNALAKFQDISNAGGKDAQFLSQANQLQNDVNQNLQGNTGAIQQNLATRGLSGGMSEMVQKQLAAQQSANRQASMGLDLNAQAQQRALAALTAGANLGGQINSQDFNQQAQQATAADAINKFNATNQQQVQHNNVTANNANNLYNNQVANTQMGNNVGIKNNAQQYNLNLPQQQYNNATGRANTNYQDQVNERNRLDNKNNENIDRVTGLIKSGVKAYAGA